uniref:Uncharacterized protein n=1 Tax=Glossina palpalis gambiensis TaxID=67801 RepID=A0A1B0AVX4_9MUSC
MKFLTLFAVAALAFTVVAGDYTESHVETIPSYTRLIKEYSTDVVEYFGRFYEFFKNFVYQVFQKVAQFFPAEVKNAFENVYKNWPRFEQLFTPEFFTAAREFFRALKDFFMPHQFYAFVDNALKAFPTVTELLPPGFWPTIGRYLEYVPFAKETVHQWYYVMEQLIPHAHQY